MTSQRVSHRPSVFYFGTRFMCVITDNFLQCVAGLTWLRWSTHDLPKKATFLGAMWKCLLPQIDNWQNMTATHCIQVCECGEDNLLKFKLRNRMMKNGMTSRHQPSHASHGSTENVSKKTISRKYPVSGKVSNTCAHVTGRHCIVHPGQRVSLKNIGLIFIKCWMRQSSVYNTDY